MRQVPRQFDGPRARYFLERRSQIRFEDELFVVLEVNEKQRGAESADFFAEEPHVLARCPGVKDVRGKAVGENAGPVSVHFVIGKHGVFLLAQGRAGIVSVRDRDRHAVTGAGKLVRKIMDVDRAVGAEVVVENEEDIAHAERRL